MPKIKWSKELVIQCIQQRKFSYEVNGQPIQPDRRGLLQKLLTQGNGANPPSNGGTPQ